MSQKSLTPPVIKIYEETLGSVQKFYEQHKEIIEHYESLKTELQTGQEEVKKFIKEDYQDKYADEKLIINYISRMSRKYDPQKIDEKFPDLDLIIIVADKKKIEELLKKKQLSEDILEGTYENEELSPSVRITLRD